MSSRAHIRSLPPTQRGVVLVMCLVFLTVLTLLALTGMETSVTEERMAGNMQDYNQAFEAAEVAMEDAEAWLGDQIQLPIANGAGTAEVWTENGPDPDADTVSWWAERDATWWAANAESSAGLEQVETQPQYVIEEFYVSTAGEALNMGTGAPAIQRVVHRVTARGIGSSGDAEVLMQSTYLRPYD
jgi:type IV pilus assembly protein PilX